MNKTDSPPIIDYEGSDYQETFWDTGTRLYEDQVEALALQRLLPASGRFILELGAGAGRNTPRYKGFEKVILVDYSRTQLEKAKARLGDNQRYVYVLANVYRLPFMPGLFDAITMIRVIHHLADVPLVLNQIRNITQPQAIFILEYANKQNLKAIARYLLGRQTWNPFSPEPVEFAALNFDFHPRQMRTWLAAAGFQVERQLTVSHFRLGLFKRIIPLNWLVALDGLAQFTGDWWQFSPSVFVKSYAVGLATVTQPATYFRCLECGHSPLDESSTLVTCPSCLKQWSIVGGIYDFRT